MPKRRDPETIRNAIKRMVLREGKKGGFHGVNLISYMNVASELRAKMFRHSDVCLRYENDIIFVKWLMRGLDYKALATIRKYIEQENINPADKKAARKLRKALFKEPKKPGRRK